MAAPTLKATGNVGRKQKGSQVFPKEGGQQRSENSALQLCPLPKGKSSVRHKEFPTAPRTWHPPGGASSASPPGSQGSRDLAVQTRGHHADTLPSDTRKKKETILLYTPVWEPLTYLHTESQRYTTRPISDSIIPHHKGFHLLTDGTFPMPPQPSFTLRFFLPPLQPHSLLQRIPMPFPPPGIFLLHVVQSSALGSQLIEQTLIQPHTVLGSACHLSL